MCTVYIGPIHSQTYQINTTTITVKQYHLVDDETCTAETRINLLCHILHTCPGLANLDYHTVVQSIIFCNGISELRRANWRCLSRL